MWGTLLTAIATATSLLIAAPAHALKVKYVAQNEVVLADSLGTADAFCPKGFHVTGGGAFSNGSYNETKIQSSYPIDGDDRNTKPDDGWRSIVWNTASTARNMESQAICTDLVTKYRSRAYRPAVSLPRVECPAGTKLAGGGVRAEATFLLPSDLELSRPSDGLDQNTKPDAWFAYPDPPGMSAGSAVTYATCVEAKRVRVKYRDASFTAEATDQSTGEILCEDPERLLGIGGAANSAEAALTSMFGADGPDLNLKLDDGSRVSVDNYGTIEPPAEAYAICVSKRP